MIEGVEILEVVACGYRELGSARIRYFKFLLRIPSDFHGFFAEFAAKNLGVDSGAELWINLVVPRAHFDPVLCNKYCQDAKVEWADTLLFLSMAAAWTSRYASGTAPVLAMSSSTRLRWTHAVSGSLSSSLGSQPSAPPADCSAFFKARLCIVAACGVTSAIGSFAGM